LVDTDVFIDHLRGFRPLEARAGIHYSVITRCELFAGQHVDEATVNELLGGFAELLLTREIAETAGRLRRTSRILTPDALIAATALEYSLELHTRNVRDFQPVPGLVVRSPA
jgi:toxin FitB